MYDFGNMFREFVFYSWFQLGFNKGWLLTLTNLDIKIETSLNNCLLSPAKTFLVGKPLKESPFWQDWFRSEEDKFSRTLCITSSHFPFHRGLDYNACCAVIYENIYIILIITIL